MTGNAARRISEPITRSTSDLATKSQSAIGLSKTSRKGTCADERIGARAELQLVGVRRKADVDRQHPEVLQQLENAVLGGDRQRDDEQIDAGDAAEIDQFGDGAELRVPGDGLRRAVVLAVVERCRRCGCRCRVGPPSARISVSAGWPPPTITARRSRAPLAVHERTIEARPMRKPVKTTRPATYQVPTQTRE